jgi:glucokinase
MSEIPQVMAFDLGGTSLKYGYGNVDAGLLYYNAKFHKEKNLTGLADLFRTTINQLKNTKHNFSALSIATPGIINAETGIIKGSVPNLPFLKNVNLKDMLYEIAKIPVFTENDANLMTLAESYHSKTNSVVGITIGTGLGTGFVSSGRIFNGENFRAMEAGHIIVVAGGRRCLCGKKGCLEAYCSADSMKRIIWESFPDTDGLSIFKILNHESPEVHQKIQKTLDIFAIGISNIIMMLDPGTVVIGGGVIEIEAYDFEYLKNRVYELLTPDFHECQVKKAVHGNKAGTIGAMLYGHQETQRVASHLVPLL